MLSGSAFNSKEMAAGRAKGKYKCCTQTLFTVIRRGLILNLRNKNKTKLLIKYTFRNKNLDMDFDSEIFLNT